MSDVEFSSIARRALGVVISLWVTIVFQGFVLGSAILFLRYAFEPYLIQNFTGVVSLNIPEWLYFVSGVAVVMLVKAIRGQPLLRDNHREQFEAVEFVTRKLPKLEQTQIYRGLARKMVDSFHLDSDLKIDFASEAKKLLEEEE